MASHVTETPLTNGELLLEIRGLAVELQRRLVNYRDADEETAEDAVADAGLGVVRLRVSTVRRELEQGRYLPSERPALHAIAGGRGDG